MCGLDLELTHRCVVYLVGLNNMATILRITFSNAFYAKIALYKSCLRSITSELSLDWCWTSDKVLPVPLIKHD